MSRKRTIWFGLFATIAIYLSNLVMTFDVNSWCKMHFWLEIEMSFNFNYYDKMNFLKEIRVFCAMVLLRNSDMLPIVHWYDFIPQMDGMIFRFNCPISRRTCQLSEWPLSIQSSIPSWFYGLYCSHLKVQYLHLLSLHRCVES